GQSSNAPLFPADKLDDILAWDRRSEALLGPGRMLVLRVASADPAALRGDLPKPVRNLPGATLTARAVLAYLSRKYAVAGSDEELRQRMRTQLVTLRQALRDSDYLLGTFSYADIAMVVALQGVRPPEGRQVPLSRASRSSWTRGDLAEEFADLLSWRDRIYHEHAPRRAPG
ncbi:MAG: hypothetical protein AAGC55_16020, partial [Myxococcota bacterium]